MRLRTCAENFVNSNQICKIYKVIDHVTYNMTSNMATSCDKIRFLQENQGLYGYDGRIDEIRQFEFQRLAELVYLDHTGATLYPQSLLDAWHKDLSSNVYGNPHSRHPSSQLVTDTIAQVRYRVLQHYNTTADQYSIIFTSGCTAALKLLAETFDWRNNVINSTTSILEKTVKNNNTSTSGCFVYLEDSHTSVMGMREIAYNANSQVTCISRDQLKKVFSSDHLVISKDCKSTHGNGLFVYPAQCNFSGEKYPLNWLKETQNGVLNEMIAVPPKNWYTLLDAASFVSTSHLDLSKYQPDFVCISFYKIFGFPTGLGALIVKNTSGHILKRTYFGGGTVQVAISGERFHVDREDLADRFEDGTVSFLDIMSLRHGFDTLQRLTGGMNCISNHTFSLARYCHHYMVSLHHWNGFPVARLYCDNSFDDINSQGPIVNFNLLRETGEYIGFAEVEKVAALHDIHLRTGCFCNPGACKRHLGLSVEDIKKHYKAGHVCGDDKDLVDGCPTGSVRISFGFMSTFEDVQKFLHMVESCFLVNNPGTFIKKIPESSPTILKVKGQSQQVVEDYLTEEKPFKDSVQTEFENPITLLQNFLQRHSILERSSTPVDNQKEVIQLTNIYLYPVKSCGAFEVKEWIIGKTGLLFDREWMIVTESGICLSQKRENRLCLIKPSILLEEEILQINFPGFDPLNVDLHVPDETDSEIETLICQSKVCQDRILGYDCGNEAATWLANALDLPGCRLIRQNLKFERQCINRTMDPSQEFSSAALSLANESQFLVLSRSSVRDLLEQILLRQSNLPPDLKEDSSHLEENSLIHRFRANLVINGGAAFEEDFWAEFKIGTQMFWSQGHCCRCQMICIDQLSGEKKREPLLTLAKYRGRKIPFGILSVHDSQKSSKPHIIKVGDLLSIYTQLSKESLYNDT